MTFTDTAPPKIDYNMRNSGNSHWYVFCIRDDKYIPLRLLGTFQGSDAAQEALEALAAKGKFKRAELTIGGTHATH